jgi:hypothetical protein
MPKPKARYRVVDVPGTWERAVVGDGHFEKTLEELPFGPLEVTMRLEPNEANPYGISAYVGNRQVGWLATEWAPSDPWVAWITRLDAAHIRPRFQGLHRLTDNLGEHIINIHVPGWNDEDLSAIADRLIGGQ